ncbi:adenosylcobinamide-GDP ribazoletransferase [Crossiella cryophila]|uniref:Adenosylcobinamide-GDP ribazoletransferase n=1 Tax=Crossiella cryophila TaxID=43355 RepID=A0A7W7FS25_9PSEU|nr:adenosylcobinamide-GDP ribazoletransferase [Crossiella cryophila]MBB4676641.1 adenosylcobinamide-GDP ribazoletransferase [Crossiella cryophila]
MSGLRLALSWLTVLPVRTGQVDTAVARTAIALAPFVGLLLGAAATAVLFALTWLGAPGLLAGLLVIGLLALATRGMHLDGLADTADGLGCYGPPERALRVMRDGSAGPFAVVTLIIVLGAQAVSLSALADAGRWAAVVVALAAGRTAFAWCCRHGVPAARPEGLGTLVAGTQPTLVPVAWTVLLTIAAAAATPDRPWLGPIGVLLALGVVLLLIRHVRKRFGGVTGDVLGAAAEITVLIVLAVTSFR